MKELKPGVYNNISSAEYHSGNGISRSGIMKFRGTPRHFWEAYINPNRIRKEPTPAMLLGSATHTAVLEPHLFYQEFAIKPECDRRTTAGKEIYASFCAMSIGKSIISEEQYEKTKSIRNEVLKHHEDLIKGAKIENSIYWINKETGILCKARPDIWHENLIADLKTCSDASVRTISRETYDGGYHIQAAMIQEGIYENTGKLINDFVLLCAETLEPFLSVPYILHEEAISAGRDEFIKHLKTYKRCLEKDEWPAYQPDVIQLPNFVNYLQRA